MFTQYSKKEDVRIVYSVIKSHNGEILYHKAESQLPVYRFWQNKTGIDPAFAQVYLSAYLELRPNLKHLFHTRDDLIFYVFKGTEFNSILQSTPLLQVTSNGL
jgi:hypothetical protein